MQGSTSSELSYEEQQILLEKLIEHDEIELLGPEQLKIESRQGVEHLWFGGIFIGIGLGLSILPTKFFLVAFGAGQAIPNQLVASLLGGGLVFVILRWLTDHFYILDLDRRMLLYHRKFVGFKQLIPKFSFSQIAAVAVVNTTVNTERIHRDDWLYHVTLLTKDNKQHQITNNTKNKPIQYDQMAKDLAQLLGCESYPCFEEAKSEIVYHEEDQRVEIRLLPEAPPLTIIRILKLTLIAAAAFAILLALTMIYAYFATSK